MPYGEMITSFFPLTDIFLIAPRPRPTFPPIVVITPSTHLIVVRLISAIAAACSI